MKHLWKEEGYTFWQWCSEIQRISGNIQQHIKILSWLCSPKICAHQKMQNQRKMPANCIEWTWQPEHIFILPQSWSTTPPGSVEPQRTFNTVWKHSLHITHSQLWLHSVHTKHCVTTGQMCLPNTAAQGSKRKNRIKLFVIREACQISNALEMIWQGWLRVVECFSTKKYKKIVGQEVLFSWNIS